MACQPSRLLSLLLIAQLSRRYAFMAPGLAKACLPGPGSGTGMVLRVRVWQRHDALGPGQARMAVSEPGACTGMCPLRQGTARACWPWPVSGGDTSRARGWRPQVSLGSDLAEACRPGSATGDSVFFTAKLWRRGPT